MSLLQLNRDEFFGLDGTDGYFDYNAGEHAAWMSHAEGQDAPAGAAPGAAKRQNPGLSVVTLMPKALSPSTARWAQAMGFRETPDWPPQRKLFAGKPEGYVVWPPHRKDVTAAEDREHVAAVLRKAMHAQYWRGNSITFADDLHLLAVLMGLNAEGEQFWTARAEGGAALWGATRSRAARSAPERSRATSTTRRVTCSSAAIPTSGT